MFTDGSLSEILMKSSLARLVNMLLDVLRVRKLFHRRMWFLMSHLSCSWREVLITPSNDTRDEHRWLRWAEKKNKRDYFHQIFRR